MMDEGGMVKAICRRCGAQIPVGRVKYDVHVEIVADFDGFLPEPTEEEEEEGAFADALREAEGLTAEELEDDVHQEYTLVLCRPCMIELSRELRARKGSSAENAPRRKVVLQ
jgi:hypothetical protein